MTFPNSFSPTPSHNRCKLTSSPGPFSDRSTSTFKHSIAAFLMAAFFSEPAASRTGMALCGSINAEMDFAAVEAALAIIFLVVPESFSKWLSEFSANESKSAGPKNDANAAMKLHDRILSWVLGVCNYKKKNIALEGIKFVCILLLFAKYPHS